MIVDADGRIAAANNQAADMTGRPQRQDLGLPGGDALGCVYARLPEGCGRTVHCETCTIRTSILQPVKNIPGFLGQLFIA